MLKRFFSLITIVCIIQYIASAQIPAGYYDAANGLTAAPLKTALYNIIKGHTDKGYDGLYACYTTTDNLPSAKVWDMYSIKANDSANYWYTNSASNSDHLYFILELPSDARVRLEIFNSSGVRVSTIVDARINASDSILLEYIPENASTGMLFYRLTVNGKLIQTGKLIHK